MDHGFFEIALVMKPINKISRFVNNMKDKIDKDNITDTIYKVNYNCCNLSYIGHSSMYLNKRMYHHKCNLKLGAKTSTALSKHLIENKHEAAWDSVNILHVEPNLQRRRYLECIYTFS